jgi:hypothetical protein
VEVRYQEKSVTVMVTAERHPDTTNQLSFAFEREKS